MQRWPAAGTTAMGCPFGSRPSATDNREGRATASTCDRLPLSGAAPPSISLLPFILI